MDNRCFSAMLPRVLRSSMAFGLKAYVTLACMHFYVKIHAYSSYISFTKNSISDKHILMPDGKCYGIISLDEGEGGCMGSFHSCYANYII